MSNTKVDATPVVDVTKDAGWSAYVPVSGQAIHAADVAVFTAQQHADIQSASRGSSAVRRSASIMQSGSTLDATARRLVAAGIRDGKGILVSYDRACKMVADDWAWEANPKRRANKRGQPMRQNDTLKARVMLYTSAAAQQAFAKANAAAVQQAVATA